MTERIRGSMKKLKEQVAKLQASKEIMAGQAIDWMKEKVEYEVRLNGLESTVADKDKEIRSLRSQLGELVRVLAAAEAKLSRRGGPR